MVQTEVRGEMAGIRKAICNETFEHWEVTSVLQYVGDLGYDGVEIDPSTLAETVEEITPTFLPSAYSKRVS